MLQSFMDSNKAKLDLSEITAKLIILICLESHLTHFISLVRKASSPLLFSANFRVCIPSLLRPIQRRRSPQ